jgi:dynein heavy chain
MFMFAILNNTGVALTFTTEGQQNLKGKALLVLRARSPKIVNPLNPEDENLTLDSSNIGTEVIFMEINKAFMDNLYHVCNEVFMPILGNPVNMVGWSDLVSKDLIDKFHIFLAHTYVTIGQIKGRTLLPLPAHDASSKVPASSKDKAVLLETAIVNWTKQIKSVLKRDPELILKSGKNPDPITEINFWRDQSQDLDAIHK